MITNNIIFIIGVIVTVIWLVGSFLEFRKMDKNPGRYNKRQNVNPFNKDKD